MPKVTIDDTKGLVQTSGSGLEISSELTLSSLPITSVVGKTANSTIVSPGVYTVSGSSVVTTTMPLASSVPGGVFVFRSLSDTHAHLLTGSQEASGTKVFAGMAGATPANQGSALALASVIGSSVALVSDGKSFLVMAASGSCTISGT